MNLITKSLYFFSIVVICTGTQNALSATGSLDMHYKLMKEMYTDCEIVMGNLEITMMEHWRDISFLKVSCVCARNRCTIMATYAVPTSLRPTVSGPSWWTKTGLLLMSDVTV